MAPLQLGIAESPIIGMTTARAGVDSTSREVHQTNVTVLSSSDPAQMRASLSELHAGACNNTTSRTEHCFERSTTQQSRMTT